MPLRVFIMPHTRALDKLSDLHSWPQWQLTEKTSPEQRSRLRAVRSLTEGARFQHSTKAQKPNASGAPSLSLPALTAGQRRTRSSSSGSSQAQPGPAVPAVLSRVTPTLTPRKSWQRSPEVWKLIMLHVLECEYMFPAAVRNFIQTTKPLRSQRNTR